VIRRGESRLAAFVDCIAVRHHVARMRVLSRFIVGELAFGDLALVDPRAQSLVDSAARAPRHVVEHEPLAFLGPEPTKHRLPVAREVDRQAECFESIDLLFAGEHHRLRAFEVAMTHDLVQLQCGCERSDRASTRCPLAGPREETSPPAGG
jgi:hypothetical protein